NDLTTALGDLKIVGVRPKPAGLSRTLRTNEGGKLTRTDLLSLQAKGFYPHEGKLLSNQGEVQVSTDEGVIYTLRFGEAVFSTGEELAAGAEESAGKEKEKDEAAKKDAKKPEGATENRYLMVTVAFDPTLIPEPKPEPEGPLTIPDEPFQLAPDDPKRIAEE